MCSVLTLQEIKLVKVFRNVQCLVIAGDNVCISLLKCAMDGHGRI